MYKFLDLISTIIEYTALATLAIVGAATVLTCLACVGLFIFRVLGY